MLISRALIDSHISRDKFVLVNNALREYNERRNEKSKNFNISSKILIYL